MPQLERMGGCHRVFAEFSASIEDVAEGGLWYTRIAIRAARRNPKLMAELFRRCDAALIGYARGTFGTLPGTGITVPVMGLDGRQETDREGKPRTRWIPPVDAIRYEDEPHDKWRDLTAIAETANGQPWRLDCDCGSPIWAAYWHLRGARSGIGVTQPKTRKNCNPKVGGGVCGYGMAHEYTIIDLSDIWPWPALARLPGVHVDGRGVGVFDGSVLGAMGEENATGPSLNGPPASFYAGSNGETAHVWLPPDF